MDEYALCTKQAYSAISPCRYDLEGHIIKFGTPMGRDNILFEDLCRHLDNGGRSVWKFPASKTGVFGEEELREIRSEMGHEAFAREMECDFSVSYGATYWGDRIDELFPDRQMDGYREDWPLVLAADIGVGKSFAAFLGLYINQDRFLLIDYYTGHETVGDLKEEILSQWGRDPDHIILPHDSKKKVMGYRSPFMQRDLFKLAFPEAQFILPPKTDRVEADIQQVKENLHLFWYLNQEGMPTDLPLGLRSVKQYGPKLSDDRVILSAVDKKSRANHGADAFRYMAIGLKMKDGQIQRPLGAAALAMERDVHRVASWARGTRAPRHRRL